MVSAALAALSNRLWGNAITGSYGWQATRKLIEKLPEDIVSELPAICPDCGDDVLAGTASDLRSRLSNEEIALLLRNRLEMRSLLAP